MNNCLKLLFLLALIFCLGAKRTQTTDKVLMIEPNDFGYNLQTAKSNRFQHQSDSNNPSHQAMFEFKKMVQSLRQQGIGVITLSSRKDIKTPDAVFPNNWFSTHVIDGKKVLILYPMLTPNRQAEVRKAVLLDVLKKQGWTPDITHDLRDTDGGVLEGTGSIILDRENKILYASLSPRTSKQSVQILANLLNFQAIVFESVDKEGKQIYHTNVMMSVGKEFGVICLECIKDSKQRQTVSNKLKHTGKEIIAISEDQVNHMAGNILQVKNNQGQSYIVLSRLAYDSFSNPQKRQLNRYGKFIVSDIPTIETIGGGSARCMLAEIF